MTTTPQEQFWAGEFGTAYIERNQGADLLAANLALFAEILGRTGSVASVLELGANIGMNLEALRLLLPAAAVTAVEINSAAAAELRRFDCTVVEESILAWESPPAAFELVFTKGVLIHLPPESLPSVYDKMARASSRFVLIAEYYNPTPAMVSYRGHDERLFKRDFAGEFLDLHDEFELVDYGFRYHRGLFAQDDTTWFLLARRPA